jgi:hypothetical protein
MALAQRASALPQTEALLGMNNGQFLAYNRTERRVAALGDRLGGQLFGGRMHDLRQDARQTEQEINTTVARVGDAVDRLEQLFSHGGWPSAEPSAGGVRGGRK